MDNNSEHIKALHQRLLLRLILLLLSIPAIFFLLIPLLKILSPIWVAALIASIFLPLFRRISKKSRIPRWIPALLCVILVLLTIVIPFYLLARVTIEQSISLANTLREKSIEFLQNLDKEDNPLNKYWSDLHPEIKGSIKNIISKWEALIHSGSKELLNLSLNFSRGLVSKTAHIGLWMMTFIIALFFILLDADAISAWFRQNISRHSRDKLTLVTDNGLLAVGRYLRGIFHLGIYTFFFMLIAFGIYGYPYTAALSLLFAFLDILPIVGSLTIIVPWMFLEFVFGNVPFATFLFIVAAAFFISRKFVEPKILGDATGLHPLITLSTMYVGFRYYGVGMAIILPIIILVIMNIITSGAFNDWFLDIYEFRSRLRLFLKR